MIEAEMRLYTPLPQNKIKKAAVTYTVGFVSGMISCFVNCAMSGMGDFYNTYTQNIIAHAYPRYETVSIQYFINRPESTQKNANLP